MLVHLVDIMPFDGTPPAAEAYTVLRRELAAYSPILAAKPHIVAANKMDLTGTQEKLHELREALPNVEVVAISAATGTGLDTLAERVWKIIQEEKQREQRLESM